MLTILLAGSRVGPRSPRRAREEKARPGKIREEDLLLMPRHQEAS